MGVICWRCRSGSGTRSVEAAEGTAGWLAALAGVCRSLRTVTRRGHVDAVPCVGPATLWHKADYTLDSLTLTIHKIRLAPACALITMITGTPATACPRAPRRRGMRTPCQNWHQTFCTCRHWREMRRQIGDS